MDAVEVGPSLLGGVGDRRYLVLFTTPAEMRGLGGFIGNYARADRRRRRRGTDSLGAHRRAPAPASATRPMPSADRPTTSTAGAATSPAGSCRTRPSRPTSRRWPRCGSRSTPRPGGGAPIDGVIVVDPYALAALMTFTGPITVPGYDVPLTCENAADILLREQYLTFQDDTSERIDFLDDATRLTFEALTTGDLPGPRQVTEVLGPVVDQGRLLVHSVAPDEQDFFERVDLDGALPPVDGDFLSVTAQNSGQQQDRHLPAPPHPLRRPLQPRHRSGAGRGHDHLAERRTGLGTPGLRHRQSRPQSQPDRHQSHVPLGVHAVGRRPRRHRRRAHPGRARRRAGPIRLRRLRPGAVRGHPDGDLRAGRLRGPGRASTG